MQGALTLWYPANAGGEVLRYRDFVPKLEEADAFLHAQKIADDTIVALFDSRMAARRNAPPKNGRFPLVLVFQGNGNTAADQAVLAEHIASHGFVVATLDGAVVSDEAEIFPKSKEQAEKFEAAVKTLAKMPNVDAANVSVVGHSLGARAMLLYATRNPVRAMISLDGGIGTANHVDELRTTRPLPPTLHLYEDLDAFMKPDHTFLKSLRTQSLAIEKADAMHHAHFTTWGFAAVAFPELAQATHATPATKANVQRVAERVVAFLKTRK